MLVLRRRGEETGLEAFLRARSKNTQPQEGSWRNSQCVTNSHTSGNEGRSGIIGNSMFYMSWLLNDFHRLKWSTFFVACSWWFVSISVYKRTLFTEVAYQGRTEKHIADKGYRIKIISIVVWISSDVDLILMLYILLLHILQRIFIIIMVQTKAAIPIQAWHSNRQCMMFTPLFIIKKIQGVRTMLSRVLQDNHLTLDIKHPLIACYVRMVLYVWLIEAGESQHPVSV